MRPGGVLVLGLDGGTLRILRPLAERGVMPTLARLLEEGAAGTLSSTTPWYTVPGWVSLMTGVGPGTHGLLHWVATDPSDYLEDRRSGRRFVTSADIEFPTFWDVAGSAGRTVAVINMPVTYPAWPVHGTMITGLLTPDTASSGWCDPPSLAERYPAYRIDVASLGGAADPGSSGRAIDVRAYLQDLERVTIDRGVVAAELIHGDVDLGVVVFVTPDRISHRAWPDQEALLTGRPSRLGETIESCYRSLDTAIARVLAAAGDGITTVVVADHGFGPPPARRFFVNRWLVRTGRLRLHEDVRRRVLAGRSRIRRIASRLKRSRGAGEGPDAELLDSARTTMYAVGFPHTRLAGFVVNRRGRKRGGWVSEDDAASLIDELRSELQSLHDETGEPVIRRTMTKEELGATAEGFPDVIIETHEGFVPSSRLLGNELFDRWEEPSGLHDPDGVLILHGQTVRARDPRADIVDVAPTVLGLLGIAPPAYVEGKARDDLFAMPRLESAPVPVPRPGSGPSTVSAAEENEIEQHLRTLGYEE